MHAGNFEFSGVGACAAGDVHGRQVESRVFFPGVLFNFLNHKPEFFGQLDSLLARFDGEIDAVDFDEFGFEAGVLAQPAGSFLLGSPGIGILAAFEELLPVAHQQWRFVELRREGSGNTPTLHGDEFANLYLALDDQAYGYRLHAAGGQASGDFGPQQRTELIAHNAVQDAPGLLGVDFVHVHGAWMVERLRDRALGDFIENDALRFLRRQLQGAGQVPGDRFALAVEVGSEIDHVRLGSELPQISDELGAAGQDVVDRLEVVVEVHAQFAFGQIPNVPHRSPYRIAGAEILLDGLGLGRRLHDDQRTAAVRSGLGRGLFGRLLDGLAGLLGFLL